MADPANVLMQKAQKYLRSAAVLFELEDFDSCASRAYFAMFYATQAVLVWDRGELPTQTGIRSTFVENYVDTGRLPRHAAEALNRASELQEHGDYSPLFAIDEDQAVRVLQEAEAFVNAVAPLAGQAA